MQGNRYIIGDNLFTDNPHIITLSIEPAGLSLEQFRADLPRLIAKFELLILEANEKSAVAK